MLLVAWPLCAQVCRLSVAGLNRNRSVAGDIAAECPDPIHTAPFGNWGINSNFGVRRDGHQFDGWCHDMRTCDNNGACTNSCRDGWYEWNSCTAHPRFRAPNCTLFNAAGCTEQVSTQGINVLGTQTVDVPVTCPRLAPDGASHDAGGCLDVQTYTRNDNHMSAYELDPFTGDDLVQTVRYPELAVTPACNIWGCSAAGSDWASPFAWENPSTPKVFAEMAMVVNSGTFVDPQGVCRVQPVSMQVVSSATHLAGDVAPESLVTLWVNGVTLVEESSAAQPPPTALGGLQVRVTPAVGAARLANLMSVAPAFVSIVMPAGLPEGNAVIAVLAGSTVRAEAAVQVAHVSPGLFLMDGRRASAIVSRDSIVLFGTGMRGRSNAAATVAGLPAVVEAVEAVTGTAGLDQVRVRMPEGLASGEVEVQVTVDGRASNVVTVLWDGATPVESAGTPASTLQP